MTPQQQQRKRAEIIARAIAPTLNTWPCGEPPLAVLTSAIHVALDATDADAAAWATFNAGQEMGASFQRRQASHGGLLKACKAGQAYMACLKRCWAKDGGRLIGTGGVVVAEADELDRLFDLWQTATEAAIEEAKEVTR